MNLDSIMVTSDTARMQGGGRSIFEKVADASTAGVAGAVVSGLGSIYNTGVWASNSLFGTRAEEIETGKVLGSIDRDWQSYYEANKSVIDTVGFIGGSFIPGGIAVKGLNAARAGRSGGAIRSALGYTMHKQEDFLEAGLKQIATKGGDVFSTLNKNKLYSMGFGFADNVLQTAVFETAAAVTMQRSSTFDGETWGDISWDIFKTSILGGAIGGGIEALWTNKVFRSAGKEVEARARKYDTIVALEKLNTDLGDRTFSILDDALNIPDKALTADAKFAFNYRVNGKDTSIDMDTSHLFDQKAADTVRRANQTFQKTLVDSVAEDPTVGAPFGSALLRAIAEGKAKGKDTGQIREELLTHLGGLQEIKSLGSTKVDFTKDTVYLLPGATLAGKDIGSLFSSVRPNQAANGYRIVGKLDDMKVGILGADGVPESVSKAYEAGFDLVIAGKKGKLHVNPGSSILQRAEAAKDTTLRTVFNTRTGEAGDTAVVTVADIMARGQPVVTPRGVIAGEKEWKFSTAAFTPTLDSVENSARHLWASQIEKLKGQVVDSRDFGLLDRMLEKPEIYDSTTKIKLPDGTLADVPTNFRDWILSQKIDTAQRMLVDAGPEIDHRLVSYAINVEQRWIQDAVSTEFRHEILGGDTAFRPLASYAARDTVVMVHKRLPVADGEPDFATGYIAYQQRKKLALDYADSAAMAVLKEDGTKFLDIDPTALRGRFDATGAGPTGFGASNADYGDPARRAFQDIGRATKLTQDNRRNAALDAIQPQLAKLISKGNTEVGIIEQRIRAAGEPMTLMPGRFVDHASYKDYKKLEAQVAEGAATPEALLAFEFKQSVKLDSEDTYEFFKAYHEGHQKWLADHDTLAAASGRVNHWNPEVFYPPPIDTRRLPYFAFVRAREGRVFATSETAMITARSADELKALASKIEGDHADLQVVFNSDIKLFKQAQGDYEFSKGLNAPSIDPMLRSKYKMVDVVPTLEPKAVAEKYISYIAKREDELVRSAVQVKYSQPFAELRWLSDEYTKVSTSKVGYLGKLQVREIADPFQDYQRLALNLSKRAEYTLWNNLNEFVDALGTRAHDTVQEAFKNASAGKMTWEEANRKMEQVGLRGVYTGEEDYLAAQKGSSRSLAKTLVSKGNMLLANITLRLDAANALVNTISAPITMGMEVAAIRNSLKKDPELLKAFNGGLLQAVPGGGEIPSTVKLIANATRNFFGVEKRQLLARYTDEIGSVRSDASKFHDMLQDMSLTPDLLPSDFSKKLDKWTEFGAKMTGNNWAEQFTRFVASDVMRQITDPVVQAGKMSRKEQNSFIAIFTNRTQGNYISSQRPIAFQGVIGSALGLFQTYQFNLMQQVFRHIENRDAKTLAIAAGLQSTIFGMSGLPAFDAINTHIIGNANINEQHRDIYSSVAAADKEWGDFAMYGMSAFPLFSDKAPALFTRGDLNPRHVTIIPTSFSSLPVVEASTRVIKSVWGIGNQVANGGDFGTAMLHGLEHNGISRPLAGLAQVMQGDRTTSSGSLIAANNDLVSIATATRLIGARPMDETIALNHKYRMTAYKAADRERIETLGTVIKEKIRAGTLGEEDVLDFAGRYAAVGGKLDSYGAAMQRWMKDANSSVLNTAMRAQNSVHAQRLFEVMGGDPLPDYTDPAQ
jgi:hypothetical protein